MAQSDQPKPSILTSAALAAGGFGTYHLCAHNPELAPFGYAGLAVGGIATLHGLNSLTHFIGDIVNEWKAMAPEDPSVGTAGIQSAKDLRRNGHSRPKGDFIGTCGRLVVFDNDSTHSTCFGAPGSNKTVANTLINTFLAAVSEQYDFVILNGVKGDEAPILKPAFDQYGIPLHVLHPSEKHADLIGPSAHYNSCDAAIDAARNDPSDLLPTCRLQAMQLLPQLKKGEDRNKWWKDIGTDLSTVIAAHLALTDPWNCNQPNIQRIIADPERLNDTLDEITIETCLLNGDLATMAKDLIQLQISDPKNFHTARNEISLAMQIYRPSSKIAKISRDSSFDITAGTRKKPVVIILNPEVSRIGQEGLWAADVTQSLVRQVMRHSERPLRGKIIWDEAAFAPLAGLNDLLVIGRQWFSIDLYYQSMADGRRVHGHNEFDAILANTDRKTFMSFADRGTAEYASQMMGDIGVLRRRFSQTAEGYKPNYSHERRRYASADEWVNNFPANQQLSFLRGQKPIISVKTTYAEIDPLRRLYGKSPFFDKRWMKDVRVRIEL